MEEIQVDLLGGFVITHNKQAVTAVNTARLQSLLAYLVLHHRSPQSRQNLAFLLWPDSEEGQTRTNLRNLLHSLRLAWPMADRLLSINAHTIQWSPSADISCEIDVIEFESLAAQSSLAAMERAVTIFQGELLPGSYEDWVLSYRERLNHRYADVLNRLIREYDRLRDYPKAIRYAQHLLQLDPLVEASYCELMRLHAINSDRTAVLRVYQSCVDVLQRELAIAPSSETEATYKQLLQGFAGRSSSSAHSKIANPQITFVGREPEWHLLQNAWRSVCVGESRCIFISGEAGIGKTRLAEELASWVNAQGYTTAVARCYAAEGTLVYSPLITWLRTGPIYDRLHTLPGVWLTALARLLPELVKANLGSQEVQQILQDRQREVLFEALARGILTDSKPILLVLDDLQWCDQETLEWLHFLLRFDAHAKMLIVCTVRPEDLHADHPLYHLRFSLERSGRITELTLKPLSVSESAELAQLVYGATLAPRQLAWLYSETEGNPLFVVEMTHAGAFHLAKNDHAIAEDLLDVGAHITLPSTMQAVIHRRLVQLSEPARELVGLAATIGRAFSLTILKAACLWDEDSLVHALEELCHKYIVREDGADAYDFSHGKIREVAYNALSAVRRQMWHQRVGQALETTKADQVGALHGQIAVHYEHAGMIEPAIQHYQLAGAYAAQLYAYTDALSNLSQALQLLPRLPRTNGQVCIEIDIYLKLGELLTATVGHQSPQVCAFYAHAHELASELGESALILETLSRLFYSYLGSGQLAQARKIGERLVELAQTQPNVKAFAEVFCGVGWLYLFIGELTLARVQFERCLPLWQAWLQSTPSVSEMPFPLSGANPTVNCRSFLAVTLEMLGNSVQAAGWCQKSIDLARQLNHAPSLGLALSMAATLYHLRRDGPTAEHYARETLKLSSQFSTWGFIANTILRWSQAECGPAQLNDWLRWTCDWPEQARRQDQIETKPAQGQDWLTWVRDKAEQARTQDRMGMGMTYWMCMLLSSHYQFRNIEEGLSVASATLNLIQVNGEHWVEAEVLRLQGCLLQAQGHITDAEEKFQQALLIARRQQSKLLELRASVDLARLWQAQQKSLLAYKLLAAIYDQFTDGYDTADRLEAKRLLEKLTGSPNH